VDRVEAVDDTMGFAQTICGVKKGGEGMLLGDEGGGLN